MQTEKQDLLKLVKEKANIWLGESFDKDTRDRVKYLLEHDEQELIESFYRDLEFGTGGLRGIMGAGTNRMNIYTVAMATQGLCNYLKQMFPGPSEIKAVVGHDSRNNSRLFAETAANVFSSNGIYVYMFDGLRPTPEISFAIRKFKCQSGVIITASHNPKEYNGFKVYWEDGGQVISPHDLRIINEVKKITSPGQIRIEGNPSKIISIGIETDEEYTDRISSLSLNLELNRKHSDLKIVYTPIHGTGVKLVPMSLKKFGFLNILSVPEQNIPDGNFPTVKSPNPEDHAALELALKKAIAEGAELVMATDPDGDRVGIAARDNSGNLKLLDGNQVASLLIYYIITSLKEKNRITGKEYICKTIVTTDLLNKIAEEAGVIYFDVLTGFKYIAEIIREHEGKLTFLAGGEESYGYLAGDFVRDKDAIISCCLIAEITAWAKEQNKTLFDILMDIYLKYGFYKESLSSLVKEGKEGSEEIKEIMKNYRNNPPEIINNSKVIKIIDYEKGLSFDLQKNEKNKTGLPISNVLQFFLEDGTKISIRPSGTEPKIKFYFSVNEKLIMKDKFEKINDLLEERINAVKKDLGLIN